MSTPEEKGQAMLEAMRSAKVINQKLHLEVDRLQQFIEGQKELIASLELSNETLKRRVSSLEADR